MRRHPVEVKTRRLRNFEDTNGLLTDSPIADVNARNFVAPRYASSTTTLRSADIMDMDLQGRPVDRVIFYKIPEVALLKAGSPMERC